MRAYSKVNLPEDHKNQLSIIVGVGGKVHG